MLSGVALRAQVASIIDTLSKAAVAQISRLVEDDLVVLRVEMCQRDGEIQKLKSSVEVLHAELRAAQHRATLRPADNHRHRGGDGCQSGTGDDRILIENVRHDDGGGSGLSVPDEVRVKAEPGEPGREEADRLGEELPLYEGNCGQWRTAAQSETRHNVSGYLNSRQNVPESSLDTGLSVPCSGRGDGGGFQQSPFSRGPLGFGQHRSSYAAVRRRTVKRLVFKKGFTCPYCGKCFGRAGHLERHKRIHTGEKPYRCETCGRRFNQKCSLKEHTKIHRRWTLPRPEDIRAWEEKPIPVVNPCADAHRLPKEESRTSAEEVSPKEEEEEEEEIDVLPTLVQVKSEPAEENVTRPLFRGGDERTTDGADVLVENFTAFERDSQPWISRTLRQGNTEMSGSEYLGGLAHNVTSFPGLAQLLPAPLETSCGSFSFPGKLPNAELKHAMTFPTTPYGSLDTLPMSSDVGFHGGVAAEASLELHRQRRGWSLLAIKPKKSFVCSYCGKVFERAGHLERHLRIHTGEKPYGCHLCGRCFNQKSSLKGHMKTHRNGENPDVLESHKLMFTVPDIHPLENPAQPKPDPDAFEERLPVGGTPGQPTVMVKVEPNGGEDFQTLGQAPPGGGTGALDHSELWTPGLGKSEEDDMVRSVCVLSHDVKYHLGAAAANGQKGYTSPIQDLPFVIDQEKEEVMHNSDQYTAIGLQSDLALASELQDRLAAREVTVNDYAAEGDRTAFEFDMTSCGDHGDTCGSDASRQNCFICSSCGQSFDSFSLFQGHLCKNILE